MRIVKSIAIVALVYVALVTAFESMIGTLQPQTEGSTLVLTTLGDDGSAHDRVVSKLESGGQLYVAVNHWPRAWYGRLLANPQVRVSAGRPATTRQFRWTPGARSTSASRARTPCRAGSGS
jgi:hypothetical protein